MSLSNITLSSSVRQNLLSLQGTATCSRPRRPALPPARRSTARSTIRPTSSPPPASMPAPATSATCSTASATACRSCRPPTPASPRCQSWSIPPSRSPTRRCSSPRATARRPALQFTGAGDRRCGHGKCCRRPNQGELTGSVFTFTTPLAPPSRSRSAHACRLQCQRQDGDGQSLDQFNQALVGGWRQSDGLDHRHGQADLHLDQRRRGQIITGTTAAATAALDAINISANAAGRRRWRYRCRRGRRLGVADGPRQSRHPVQPDHPADHHHGAGRVLQRHQPAAMATR